MYLLFYTKKKVPKKNLRPRLFATKGSALTWACATRKTLMPRKIGYIEAVLFLTSLYPPRHCETALGKSGAVEAISALAYSLAQVCRKEKRGSTCTFLSLFPQPRVK